MAGTRSTWRLTLAVVMALTVAFSLATVDDADAWQYTKRRSKPGKVSIDPVTVYDYTAVGVEEFRLGSRGPLVRRTPRSRRAQDVTVLYTIQRWNGAKWQTITRELHWRRIRRGRAKVRMPEWFVAPNAAVGYYRVRMRFVWFKARTNRVLALSRVRPNISSDFRCVTEQRRCRAAPGWVRIGKHVHYGGGW